MALSKIYHHLKSSFSPIFRRRNFSLLGGVAGVIALFSLLQLFSALLLSNSVQETREGALASQKNYDQQIIMEQARTSLLMTSDLLNRAGIFFLQDEKSGSVGSWESLAQEADITLRKSHEYFQAWLALSPTNTEELIQSYQLFASGLKEQLEGLQQNSSIDAYFSVPTQAFQSQFNSQYARYQQQNEQLTLSSSQTLLQGLSQLQRLFIISLVILVFVGILVWILVNRWVIFPLRSLIRHLHIMAAGDLSCSLPRYSLKNREVQQLHESVTVMQRGLQQLVSEVREASTTLLSHIGQLVEGNHALSQQSTRQEQELNGVVQHINHLASRVEENNQYALLAHQRVTETQAIVAGGDRMMQTVNTSMQNIVSHSAEMEGIISMIEGVAFQTNILALNAAIEAAHAGHQGRGFAVVAREVGLLAKQSGASTQKIQTLINHSLQGIEQGGQAVSLLEQQLKNVVTEVVQLRGLLGDISTASADQDNSVSHVSERIDSLNQAVNQTGLLIRTSTETSEQLLSESERLEKAVSRFQMAS